MAGITFASDMFYAPMVDHPHERAHQHQSFLRCLAGKQPDPKSIANTPDVDIRDAIAHYLLEIEVPGVRYSANIRCQWTSSKTLIVSGEIERPAYGQQKKTTSTAGGERNIPATDDDEEEPPYVLVGERRIGSFKRLFTFPVDVDTEKLTAKLDAGLLCITVPKKEHHTPTGNGKVKVETMI